MNEMEYTHTDNSSEIAKLILSQDDWGAVEQHKQEIIADEDEIFFKPLTEGLGFTKPVETVRELKKSIPRQNKEFKYIDRPAKNKKEMLGEMSSRALGLSDDVAKTSHLSAFYQDKPQAELKAKKAKKKKQLKVSVETRFTAWAIDMVFISLMVLGFVGVIAGILKLDFFVLLTEVKTFVLPVSAMFYVIYFTILDLDRSFGKSLLGIKIVKARTPISIVDTFIRTMASLISIACFGIPFLFNLHEHLSDTKVIKWK